jgi:hypothetical protein
MAHFGIAYTNPDVLVPQPGVYYTPMPVYELIINLGIFAVLWKLRSCWRRASGMAHGRHDACLVKRKVVPGLSRSI